MVDWTKGHLRLEKALPRRPEMLSGLAGKESVEVKRPRVNILRVRVAPCSALFFIYSFPGLAECAFQMGGATSSGKIKDKQWQIRRVTHCFSCIITTFPANIVIYS